LTYEFRSFTLTATEFITSVSDDLSDCFARIFPRFRNKIRIVYFGPHKNFRVINDRTPLALIRAEYGLPERFVLTVIHYDHGTKNTPKNFPGMAEAFSKYKKTGGTERFVVVGRDCDIHGKENDLEGLCIKDNVIFPGLVAQEDLPAFYNLASLYLYPTIIEN